ncbi:MAG: sulfatase [Phycisphaerae bacterium]
MRTHAFWRRIAAAGLLGLSTTPTPGRAEPPGKPNIVFILADDLGYADVGCMGSRFYHTPNIDRLAAEGMRLTNFHQSQNCAPTRACLMSGQYAPRTGVYTVGSLNRGRPEDRRMIPPANVTQLPLDRKTIADQLKDAGYVTGMFGKWHLGNQGDHHPARRGFDKAIVVEGDHFGFRTIPPTEVPAGGYDGDWITDRALAFIEKHKDRPFFLYVPHRLVHSPFQAKPGMAEKYEKRPPAGGQNNPTYAAMIESLDESVGRIIAQLDRLRLTSRTVVVFTSDNGGIGSYREAGADNVTDNAPLRGGKGQLYEGGLRVPMIVRWPGVTPPGSSSAALGIHVDLYATFLEIGGAGRPPQPIDGVSLTPVLRDPSARLEREAVFSHFPGYLEGYGKPRWRTTPAGMVIAGEWKLLEFYEDARFELYHLGEDLGENRDLAGRHPEKVAALSAKLAAWREELKAAMPATRPAAP